jgi:DNA-binding LacI/PurR family transcriptional regulator
LHRHREFEGYWQGAREAAKQFGYVVEEVRWPMDCPAKRYERILTARGIQGVLILPHPHRQSPEWEDFDWHKFSLIRFGMSVHNPDSNVVTSDQFRATVMAMANIHRLGYRKIGFILNRELDENIGGNYTGGFFAAQKLFGVKAADSLLIVDPKIYRQQPARAEKELGAWRKKNPARRRVDCVVRSSRHDPQAGAPDSAGHRSGGHVGGGHPGGCRHQPARRAVRPVPHPCGKHLAGRQIPPVPALI